MILKPSEINASKITHAQLVKRQTTAQEVVGSNPSQTKNQGLKITGKIMLAVCST